MNTYALAVELAELHPTTGLPYSNDDATAAGQLNAVNCTRLRNSVTGQEIFEAAVPTEYNVLSDDQKRTFLGIVGMGDILVNGFNTRAALLLMFDNQTTTRVNLIALQTESISRAIELGLGYIAARHIQRVRGV